MGHKHVIKGIQARAIGTCVPVHYSIYSLIKKIFFRSPYLFHLFYYYIYYIWISI